MSIHPDDILRVRAYLTLEESAFVEDVQVAQAYDMAEKVRITRGLAYDPSTSAKFAASIIRAALRKGMLPEGSASRHP
jgi:hypothetical protein